MFTVMWDDRSSVLNRFELPTWTVLVVNYSLWFLLVWNNALIPWWALLALGGFTVCLHGSLQHEFLHGHPTRSAALNRTLVWLPIGLWMPYTIYRDSHVAHHGCESLTDPLEDPESFYLSAARWEQSSRLTRAILTVNNTLAGRLLIGPIVAISQFWSSQVRQLIQGDRRYLAVWVRHLVGCAAVLYFVVVLCGMPLWQYLLFFAWPGLSLTLLRSYTEHRPAAETDQRTIIIEGSLLTRLLFLNNNFHHVHHAEPALPWYLVGARYRHDRERVNRENGGFYFKSYLELFRNYLLWPKDKPVYPTD